jgi:hypothetical protein
MGKQRKAEEDKRTKRFEMLWSPKEWAKLQHNAKWEGVNHVEYIRLKTVEAEPFFKPPPDRLAMIDGLSDLRSIKNHLSAISQQNGLDADTESAISRMGQLTELIYETIIDTLDHGSTYRKHKGRG